MTRSSSRLALIIGAFCLALVASPAFAAQRTDTITVVSPSVQREVGQRSYGDVPYGRPVTIFSTSLSVRTSDLNLNYEHDRRVLNRRIRDAAIVTCQAIDDATVDILIDDQFTCVRQTARDARRAVYAAMRTPQLTTASYGTARRRGTARGVRTSVI